MNKDYIVHCPYSYVEYIKKTLFVRQGKEKQQKEKDNCQSPVAPLRLKHNAAAKK